MIKKYKQFLETFSYQVSEKERESISKNLSFGFNFPEDAGTQIILVGTKNIPNQIYITDRKTHKSLACVM